MESISLYAESENERAKQTYFRLGMKVIQDKIYSYDFVLGGFKVKQDLGKYSIGKFER